MPVFACQMSGPPVLDELAAEYVRLAGLTERSDPAFIDAIVRARHTAREVAESGGRRAFLLAQLAALERRARLLSGRRVSIRDEALSLGLPVPTFDAGRASDVRAALERALPGTGALPDRLLAYRRAAAVPRARLEATVTRLLSDCQSRTPRGGELVDRGVGFRYVLDQPWPAFTVFVGEGRSRVDIRRDVAWLEEELRVVLCHETYPGHHLQNLVWDGTRRERGWVEFSVKPMFTPHAVMAERAAIAATELAWPRAARPVVARLLDELSPFAAATAVDVVDGALARSEGLARLREELLMPNPDEFLSFVEEYRSMALAYVSPALHVEDWQSYLALLRSPERLVAGARQ